MLVSFLKTSFLCFRYLTVFSYQHTLQTDVSIISVGVGHEFELHTFSGRQLKGRCPKIREVLTWIPMLIKSHF